jgi:hypothetical protein
MEPAVTDVARKGAPVGQFLWLEWIAKKEG